MMSRQLRTPLPLQPIQLTLEVIAHSTFSEAELRLKARQAANFNDRHRVTPASTAFDRKPNSALNRPQGSRSRHISGSFAFLCGPNLQWTISPQQMPRRRTTYNGNPSSHHRFIVSSRIHSTSTAADAR